MRVIPASDLVPLTGGGARLAEGPVWDVDRQALWWVDITGGRLHRTGLAGGDAVALDVTDPVGSLVLATDGTPIVAVGTELGALVGDGRWRPLVALGGSIPDAVLNDSGCDPAGRLWIGVSTGAEREPIGCLRRVTPWLEVRTPLAGLTVPNGIDFSPDGETMYFVDSPTRRVLAFPFRGGELGPPQVFGDDSGVDGLPDGLTVDATGAVWVAYWGGWCVRRFAPSGVLDTIVEVPAALVTSCAFGGPELDELFITTACEGLSPDDLRAQPAAGTIMRVRPGVGGLPARRFAWSSSTGEPPA